MRFEFTDKNERAQLAQQLGLPTEHVTDEVLARAVADRLQRQHPDSSSYFRDIEAIDASGLSDYERRQRKRERYERELAAQRRREHTPSDADDRPFDLTGDAYDPDWLTAAERSKVEQSRLERKGQRSGVISVPGPGALRARSAAPKPARRGVHFGQGKITYPEGDWNAR